MARLKLTGWYLFVAFALSIVANSASAAGDEMGSGPWASMKESYDALPPKGKFATGAAVGFGASRIAIKTTVGVLKIGGAAFIASEVLNYAGVLDQIDISDENMAIAKKMKHSAMRAVNDFRVNIRRQMKPEIWKSNISRAAEEEKMATLGFAAGAFVGFAI